MVNLACSPPASSSCRCTTSLAATCAFVVAVANNFWWNRHWTFGAADGHAGFQAARFFTVSVAAFLFAAADPRAARQRGRHGRGPGAGDLDRRGHAAQLRREQNVELRALAAAGLALAFAASARPAHAPPSSTAGQRRRRAAGLHDDRARRRRRRRARRQGAAGARERHPELRPDRVHRAPGPLAGVAGSRSGDERRAGPCRRPHAARSSSRGRATRSRGGWRAATRARSAASGTRPGCWIPLGLLFLLPFVDFRRPLRLLHLDLLVLLGFGVSHVFFNRGDIGVSVPLAYPVLLYVMARMLWEGWRRRERAGALVPHVPLRYLLLGARLPRRVPDRAERDRLERHRRRLLGRDRRRPHRGRRLALRRRVRARQPERERLRAGRLPRLPAVGAAAAVERQLGRPARRARRGDHVRPARRRSACTCSACACEAGRSGVALAYAWVAFPVQPVRALDEHERHAHRRAARLGARRAASPAARGALRRRSRPRRSSRRSRSRRCSRRSGGPLRVRRRVRARRRWSPWSCPFLPDGGLRDFYDTTLGFHAGRDSPFSVWGQEPGSTGSTPCEGGAAGAGARASPSSRAGATPSRWRRSRAAVLIAPPARRRCTGSTSTSSGSRRSCWWRCSPRTASRREPVPA